MIRPWIVGFKTTLKHMFKKPVSVNYPDEKVPMFPKWRGKQVLMRDEHGLEKCVACGLCAVACPADAIYLEAAENDGSVMAGPRYARTYQIHKTRCIFCGYCEEACPVSAIFMGKDYELAVYSKDDFVWDKDDLLVPLTASAPPHSSDVYRLMVADAFLDALRERVLICDGAMGTQLYAQGVFLNRAFEELNLTQPDLVLGVHNSYVRAGADVIETNSFGANRLKLSTFGLGGQVHAINLGAARLARHAARDAAFVAGSIGPLGVRVEPWGKTGLDEAQDIFREQAAALAEGGVDVFILETFRDVSELGAAIAAVRDVSPRPVVAMLTTGEDGASLDGMLAEQFTQRMLEFGPDVIGVNCSVGPAPMLDAIERIAAAAPHALLAALPNAGRPRDVDGRNLYLCSPDYMASYARRFALAGVRFIGGCCGTTPDHIRQIRHAVHALESTPAAGGSRLAPVARVERPTRPPVPRAGKSRLANALARGHAVIGVEIEPPPGHYVDRFVEVARQARIRGADFVLVPTAPGGRAHTSALAAAVTLEQKAGVETILQYCCRDHSLHAMQADLLGAHALGVRNLLLVTGRPRRLTEYPDATAVFDVDSIGLTNVVGRFNVGEDVGAQPIGEPTAFHVGVAANPTAVLRERELSRYRYKVEAGAEFVVMGPIYDPDALRSHFNAVGDLRVPTLAIVRAFESARQAEQLAYEEPDVEVPSYLVRRMVEAEARGEAAAEAQRIAAELIVAIRPLVEGLILAGPTGDASVALDLLTAASAEEVPPA